MNDLETGFTVSPVRRELPQDRPPLLTDFLDDDTELRLVVRERVLNGIRGQAGASPDNEIGGVLVGRHYRTGDRYLVEVQDHVIVPSRNSGAAHFEFDQSSIQAIFERLKQRPDQYVVGWYHSHTFGKPFMSQADHNLHRAHFPEPWYVSCVTSLGSRGRSAGFWRMREGELVEIDDYGLSVATGGDPAATQEQYLTSCGMSEAEQPALASLLPLLGTPVDSVLYRLLDGLADGWAADPGLSEVRFLIRAAKTAATDRRAVVELDELEQRLGRLRLLSDALTPVAVSARIRGRISVSGTECYCYQPDDRWLLRLDLGRYHPFPVRVKSTPVCVAHAPDGHAWVLTANSTLLRFPTVDIGAWLSGDHSFEVRSAALPELDELPEQIVPTQDALWLRTASTWHRYDCTVAADGEIALGGYKSGRLPRPGCLLIVDNGFGTPSAQPALIANDAGLLRTWKAAGDGWAPAAEAELPAPWDELPLAQACVSGHGWHVLFDAGPVAELCVFDLDSLELKYHVVREEDEEGVTGICGDGFGQAYLQTDGILYRA